MLSISLSSPPVRENGPNFGFTMHASKTVLKITSSPPSSAFVSQHNWVFFVSQHNWVKTF